MKRINTLLLFFASLMSLTSSAQDFASGADVSWCTEMEASGKYFYNSAGQQTEMMALLAQLGMTAVRLRVWVNPETAYGPWCDKADVVAKAKRAKNAGLDVMIDFHYSDFFADPGRQTKPTAWKTYTFEQLKQAVNDHTVDVLQALKDEGVTPKWVQVGNETRLGMIWNDGKIVWSNSQPWAGYVALSNAGYDAVKSVFPSALVIVHLDRAPESNSWFFQQFKDNGGKFDAIGLSHYPETSTWQANNISTASNIRSLHNTFQVPVILVETGYYWNSDNTEAEEVMTDLFSRTMTINGCGGIFYWEPEVYNWWKPTYYQNLGWNAYNKGAFNANGRPSAALNPFNIGGPTGINSAEVVSDKPDQTYDLMGRKVDATQLKRGIYIRGNKKVMVK